MRKIFKAIISLLMICILLMSCSLDDTPQNNSDPNENITTENKMERIEVPDEFFAYGYEMKLECLRHRIGFHGEVLSQYSENFTEEQLENFWNYRDNESKKTIEYFDEHGTLPPKCNAPLNEIIEVLGLTKEEFVEAWYFFVKDAEWGQITQEQIDALFSGDDALIEELWCDPEFAFYHDGRCYSIWDILDSGADTLAANNFPGEKVRDVLIVGAANPNFSIDVYNFIADSTQKELAINFGFTAEDFAAIDTNFEWMASYHRIGLEQLSEDRKAWYNDLINKFESFEVSASFDVIDKEEEELGVIGGEEEPIEGES